jgi:hypothetical protein
MTAYGFSSMTGWPPSFLRELGGFPASFNTACDLPVCDLVFFVEIESE